jgi:hypothetical protein
MTGSIKTHADLKSRVLQFDLLQLPGQPQGMHMGTSYLVHDLWERVQALEGIARDLRRYGLTPYGANLRQRWEDACARADAALKGVEKK